ncbi:hypothetical protein OVA07_17035 [Novosphingobium sp. SL115]|uniref:hypothetical protein n=1 Tax=Novosphingobium sp. SL115 TaxID=2995150 RepID=UPI0022761637|nr:hypothetical protein [Novosphingobium sp. SL115]MCY1672706.1 hypothetical protein [Novosphingobium sp. SL115]
MATPLSDYAAFLNCVLGTIDDAELSGFDQDGIAHLREAYEFFSSDYRIRRHSEDQAQVREAAARSQIARGNP